ncbi:MAG: PIN domain-containing protein [Oceanospirillaceae bacterium]|nr:PIN domain-containing protein [Oceanospirillaceae bacterium]
MQQLLISDTNVIIDLEEGGLIAELFALPYTFAVPDILFYEELDEQHCHLLDMGLILKELSEQSMGYALKLVDQYRGPSTNDCLALALAKQEGCPLITGDKRLRTAADLEDVEKLGTIWLLEQMLINEILTIAQVDVAVALMKQSGSRLPWDLLEAMLRSYR